MAEKDPLQSSINSLNRNIQDLNTNIKSLSSTMKKAEATSSNTSKVISADKRAQEKAIEDIKKVLIASGLQTKKDGNIALNNALGKKIDAFIQRDDTLKNYLEDALKRVNAYNKDNPKDKIDDLTKVPEIMKEVLEEVKKAVGDIKGSKDFTDNLKKEIRVPKSEAKSLEGYKLMTEKDGTEVILKTTSDLSQLRSEVVKLKETIQENRKEIDTELKSVSKLVTDLAEKSSMLRQISKNLEKTMDSATTASDKVVNEFTVLRSSIQDFGRTVNTASKSANKAMSGFDAIKAKAEKFNFNSSSSNNSFREQARRNSDRASQKGFVGLLLAGLIPALQKIFNKVGITDYLKLLALRFGSGKSGTGEHPVLGTVGYMAAGAAGITASIIFRKQLASFARNLLSGRLSFANPSKLPKGVKAGVPITRAGQYSRGWLSGFLDNPAGMSRNERVTRAVQNGGHRFLRDANGNLLHKNNQLFSRAFTWGGEGYSAGNTARRVFNARTARFARNAWGVTKGLGKKIPLLGALFEATDDIGEGKFGRAYKKEGIGGWFKQLGKTTVGAAAGAGGWAAGTATGAAVGTLIGGPIGTVVGGAVGFAVGGVLAPMFKNVADVMTNNVDETSTLAKASKERWGKEYDKLNVFEKLLLAISNPIVSIWNWIKEKFHIGEPKGPDASKNQTRIDKMQQHDVAKYQKANEDIDRQLKTYTDKNSTAYAQRRGELYNQYIKANTPKGQNKTVAQKLGFGERDPEISKKAWEWADKMMNEEQYKLQAQKQQNAQKMAVAQNAIGTLDVSKLATVNKNGVDAVAMSSLGLKGAIAGDNSIPYVAKENAQNLKNLDNYLAMKGYQVSYTSAMGGHGANTGHGQGRKIDFQLTKNGKPVRLTKAEENDLMRMGYWNKAKVGAQGWEAHANQYGGGHYDVSISGGLQATTATATSKSTGTETKTATDEQQVSVSTNSGIRDALMEFTKSKKAGDRASRAQSIIFQATDVTGSLGVWGITQLNNGGRMRQGR